MPLSAPPAYVTAPDRQPSQRPVESTPTEVGAGPVSSYIAGVSEKTLEDNAF
jgi:hypothetical protein